MYPCTPTTVPAKPRTRTRRSPRAAAHARRTPLGRPRSHNGTRPSRSQESSLYQRPSGQCMGMCGFHAMRTASELQLPVQYTRRPTCLAPYILPYSTVACVPACFRALDVLAARKRPSRQARCAPHRPMPHACGAVVLHARCSTSISMPPSRPQLGTRAAVHSCNKYSSECERFRASHEVYIRNSYNFKIREQKCK